MIGKEGPDSGDRSERLASLAEDAIGVLREENEDIYRELVDAFDGKSANVAVFGVGRFSIAVHDGEVSIGRELLHESETARGAIYPEAAIAITEGRISPLDAFFKGDLVARAPSGELHRAYGYVVRFSDAILRSDRQQELAAEFRTMVGY